MAEKKRFLLRIDPDVYRALEKWAADDLRSVNAQIEFLVKDALTRAGRAREERRDDGREPRDA
jgi:hypothetical protein